MTTMTAVGQRFCVYSLTTNHLKSIRYAINRRLLVLTDKLRAASAPEKIERYRDGIARLTSLQSLISDSIRQDRPATRVTFSEIQSGTILHALKLAHEEKSRVLDTSATLDLRDVEQLEGLARAEKIFKDSLPVYILRQAGYEEEALRTVF
jgi:hypothetical protein